MMSKDSVKNRLESGMKLHRIHLPVGAGIRLLSPVERAWRQGPNGRKRPVGQHRHRHRTHSPQGTAGQAFAITAPLITKADGSKFGQSEGGNVWLDKNRTSAYKFYQYWINAADADASRYLRIFTLLSREDIEAIEAAHAENPGARAMQKALAEDVTRRIHGQADLDTAIATSSLLFGKSSQADLRALPEAELLSVFEGVPQRTVSHQTSKRASASSTCSQVATLLSLASNGEARRALKEGSVSVNKVQGQRQQSRGRQRT